MQPGCYFLVFGERMALALRLVLGNQRVGFVESMVLGNQRVGFVVVGICWLAEVGLLVADVAMFSGECIESGPGGWSNVELRIVLENFGVVVAYCRVVFEAG